MGEASGEAHFARRQLLNCAMLASGAFLASLRSHATPLVNFPPLGPPPPPKCLLKGASVLAAGGPSKVENLKVGDLLPTLLRGLRLIEWIGRFPIARSDPSTPWPKDARAVRIARSALTPNVLQFYGFARVVERDGSTIDQATCFDQDDSAEGHTHGHAAAEAVPCLPVLSPRRRERGLKALLRSALSSAYRRRRIASIRAQLAERARVLSGDTGIALHPWEEPRSAREALMLVQSNSWFSTLWCEFSGG